MQQLQSHTTAMLADTNLATRVRYRRSPRYTALRIVLQLQKSLPARGNRYPSLDVR